MQRNNLRVQQARPPFTSCGTQNVMCNSNASDRRILDPEFLDLKEEKGKCCCSGYCTSETPNRAYEDQK